MAKHKQKNRSKKVVPISGRKRVRPVAAGEKATPQKVRRLRFHLPAGSAERLAGIRDGLGRSWRELAIRLRLSRGAREEVASGRKPARGKVRTGYGYTTLHRGTATRVTPGRWKTFGERHPQLQGWLRPLATVDGWVALFLAVLLFYPPFFRGLFFAQELLPTHVFTAMLFALLAFYKVYRREPLFSGHPLDWAVVVLLCLYVTSSLVAWNARDALGAVLKMANYVAIYWLLAYSVRSLKAVRGYLAVFFASGTGVAVLGLGAAFGTFHYKDAFVNGRIYSSLQYPNTLAAFLTAINLFGLHLWAEARRLPARLLLALGSYLMFLTFLGTQSRGALLIYPLGLLVLLVGLPGRSRWRALFCFVLQAVASLAVFGRVMAAANAHAGLAGWLWTLAGAALILLLQLAWHLTEQGIRVSRGAGEPAVRRTLKPWVLPAVVGVLVLLLAGGGYTLLRQPGVPASTGAGSAWHAWVQRLETISLKEKNAEERTLWSRDAFRIMTSSPVIALLGAGGGGWNALYHQYQDYLYFSTEVHNHFLQVGVETGFPGLLAFIAIWVAFLLSTWRNRRLSGSDPDGTARRGTGWAICSAALALGAHSVIDFNLSLGAVAILLWGLFGLERGLESLVAAPGEDLSGKTAQRQSAAFSPTVQGVVVGVLAAAFFFLPLILAQGESYAAAANGALKQQNLKATTDSLRQALRYDPWNSGYRLQLAQILLYQGSQQRDAQALNQAVATLRYAVQKSRGDAQLRQLYAQALFNTGQVQAGIAQLEQAAVLMPFGQGVYDNLAAGYFEGGRFFLEQAAGSQAGGQVPGNPQELRKQGRLYLARALQVPGRVEARMKRVPKEHLKLWTRAPLLAVSPTMRLEAGKAAVLLGRWSEAQAGLQAALQDARLKPEALLWQGLALEAQGQNGEQQLNEALKLRPDLAQERQRTERLLTGHSPKATAAPPATQGSPQQQGTAEGSRGQPAAPPAPQNKPPGQSVPGSYGQG